MIGSAQNKGDAGGLAESGYWSMIESDQRTIEMHLNTQIFEKLGYIIKFKKKYKIDDLREAQTMQQRVDAVTKTQAELLKIGKKLSEPKLYSLMDLSFNDVVEADPKDGMGPMEKTGLLNKSFSKDGEVIPEPNNQSRNDKRSEEKTDTPKGVS